MTNQQKAFIDALKNYAAQMLLKNEAEVARHINNLIRFLQKGDYVFAVIYMSEYGFGENEKEQVRILFKVNKIE